MGNFRTLSDIRDVVLSWIDEVGNTDTTRTIVDNAINQAHKIRLSKRPWNFMMSRPYTFTTVNDQQTYSLHPDFDRPIYFRDNTTNEDLVEVPLSSLLGSGANWNEDERDPKRFALWGRSPVSTQPATAGILSIVSSSVADASGKQVKITGDVSGGGTATETITANGTTAANGTIAFSHITSVAKIGTWSGTMTLKDVSANTLLTLGTADVAKSFPQLFLLASPEAGNVVEYRFYRRPTDLTADGDIPDIPPPYSDILIYDTLMMLGGYNSDMSGQAFKVWTSYQTELELAMESAHIEGQTLGAMPSYIRYIPDGTDF